MVGVVVLCLCRLSLFETHNFILYHHHRLLDMQRMVLAKYSISLLFELKKSKYQAKLLTFKIVILSYMMLVYNRFNFGSPFKMDVFGSYARTKFAIFFVFYQCCQCCCCLSTIFGGNFPICQKQRKLSQQRCNNNITIRPLIRFRRLPLTIFMVNKKN